MAPNETNFTLQNENSMAKIEIGHRTIWENKKEAPHETNFTLWK